jgi:1,4-dihydroxy-2-naphthoyl-CoA hydrolase
MSVFIDQAKISIVDLNKRCENTMAEFLELKFTEIGDDFVKAEMPVTSKTVQPIRMLNGGASLAIAEILGSVAANLALDRSKFIALGLDINGNHLKPVPEGEVVYATASPLHVGKTTHVWQIRIENEAGDLVSICRLTLAIRAIS